MYFVQAGENGPVKVGVSCDPYGRLHNLQTSHYEPLTLFGHLPGDEEVERRLHSFFAEDHIRGEWYRPSKSVMVLARASTDVAYADGYPITLPMRIETTGPGKRHWAHLPDRIRTQQNVRTMPEIAAALVLANRFDDARELLAAIERWDGTKALPSRRFQKILRAAFPPV